MISNILIVGVAALAVAGLIELYVRRRVSFAVSGLTGGAGIKELARLRRIEEDLGECTNCQKPFLGEAASVASPPPSSEDGLPFVTCWRCEATELSARLDQGEAVVKAALDLAHNIIILTADQPLKEGEVTAKRSAVDFLRRRANDVFGSRG